MSDFEDDVDMEGGGEGGESEAESDSSSSKSSSSSSSSTSSSSSEEIIAPAPVVLTEEEKKLAVKVEALEKEAQTCQKINDVEVMKVWMPLVDVMTSLLRLQEVSPLVGRCLTIAKGQKELSKAGEVEPGLAYLPRDELIRRLKLELSRWERRIHERLIWGSLRKWKDRCRTRICAAERRGLGMEPSRDLEEVLCSRAEGGWDDTDLARPENVAAFALDAWTIMDPDESELKGTLLEGGVTAEKLDRWLQQKDAALESIFQWRRLRAARSEQLAMDDADLKVPPRPISSAAPVAGTVSMRGAKRRVA